MQLIVATHSPVFIEEALRQGTLQVIEWEDRAAALARVTPIRATEAQWAHVRRSADFLYARTVLFVEGKSDEAALWELRHLVTVPCYVMALGIKDWFLQRAPNVEKRVTGRERLAALAPLAHVRGGGPARLLLDDDAREIAMKVIDKLDIRELEPPVFVGESGQDFESAFCEREFLADFFRSNGTSSQPEELLAQIDEVLSMSAKGCERLSLLFDALGESGADKQDILAKVARHFASRPTAFSTVRQNLTEVLRVYDAGDC